MDSRLQIEELENRYRKDIVGNWSSGYFSWCPTDEDMEVRSDGTGVVTGMCSDLTFKWERHGDFSMKVWDIAYPGAEDPEPDPEEHIVIWRFELRELHDGAKRVELILQPMGVLVISGLV